MDPDDLPRVRIRQWQDGVASPMPEWWEWAVAGAQYHLRDCDWVTTGITGDHCSCHLTRVIAKIISEARA